MKDESKMPVRVKMDVQDWKPMILKGKINKFTKKIGEPKGTYQMNTLCGFPCLKVCVDAEPVDQKQPWPLMLCFKALLQQGCDPNCQINRSGEKALKLIEYIT